MSVNEPAEAEINRGIAEWIGWIIVEDGDHSFTTSHDACREAVRHMTDEQFEEYVVWLDNIVDPKSKHDDCPCMDCLRATSQQEALAIYRTITAKP